MRKSSLDRHLERMAGRRRGGVLYNMDEEGKARIVFESPLDFEGTLETKSGEVLSIRGVAAEHADVTNIRVVVGESGSVFLLEGAVVKKDTESATISHPALAYSSDEKLVGMRARREIQEYLNPRLAEDEEKVQLFIGFMKVSLLASDHSKPSIRRESICEDNTRILETSDDFLA